MRLSSGYKACDAFRTTDKCEVVMKNLPEYLLGMRVITENAPVLVASVFLGYPACGENMTLLSIFNGNFIWVRLPI